MTQPKQQPAWHRSTHCTSGTCVEIAEVDGHFLVRNSSEPDTVVAFSRDEWVAFLKGARAGQFG